MSVLQPRETSDSIRARDDTKKTETNHVLGSSSTTILDWTYRSRYDMVILQHPVRYTIAVSMQVSLPPGSRCRGWKRWCSWVVALLRLRVRLGILYEAEVLPGPMLRGVLVHSYHAQIGRQYTPPLRPAQYQQDLLFMVLNIQHCPSLCSRYGV